MKSISLVVLIGILGSVHATNFCSTTINCGTNVNIGCKNNGAFATTCPASKVMVPMTSALLTAIVNKHNTLRNTLAAGNLTGFDSAKRMATMRWDAELAVLASFNAKRCAFAHDACRNTNTYLWSGQNLAKNWWSGSPPIDTTTILSQIDGWWAENKDTNMTYINSYQANPSAVIGHFTVMTSEKNIALGCAGIKYKDPAVNNWNSLTLVCNYARTNIMGAALYASGPPASNCTRGKNPSYPALCNLAEIYPVNVV